MNHRPVLCAFSLASTVCVPADRLMKGKSVRYVLAGRLINIARQHSPVPIAAAARVRISTLARTVRVRASRAWVEFSRIFLHTPTWPPKERPSLYSLHYSQSLCRHRSISPFSFDRSSVKRRMTVRTEAGVAMNGEQISGRVSSRAPSSC